MNTALLIEYLYLNFFYNILNLLLNNHFLFQDHPGRVHWLAEGLSDNSFCKLFSIIILIINFYISYK